MLKRLRIIKNIFKESGRNIVRFPFITLASLTTMFLMLLVLGVFIVFTINANTIMDRVGQTPPVQIWLRKEVNDDEINAINEALKNSELVSEFKLQSPEDNYNEYKETLGEDAALLDSLDPNVLPYSYTVKLTGQDVVREFQSDMETYSGVDDVQYSETVRNFMSSASKIVNSVSIAVVLVLFVIALIVISNMTRMSIFARSEEISIMKHVGASSSYIRVPYFLEGAFIGILGAVLACTSIVFLYKYIYEKGMADTPLNSPLALVFLSEIVLPLVLITLLTGAIVGAFGSGMSVRKYVNV